jgi:hypothetical protein
MKIDATGTFLPATPVEVRSGRSVQGRADDRRRGGERREREEGRDDPADRPRDLNRELDAARNELTTAKANQAKAEADVALGEKADALAMKQAENAMQEGRRRPEVVGRPRRPADAPADRPAAEADGAHGRGPGRRARPAQEDVQDRRPHQRHGGHRREARRAALEIGKAPEDAAGLGEEGEGVRPAQSRLPLEFAAEQAKQAMERSRRRRRSRRSRADGAEDRATRDAAAEKKVADLEKDSRSSPCSAGGRVVVYGSVAEGAVTPVDPKTLRAKEKLAAGTTVMVLFTPGALKLAFDLPEAKLGG